ncbi:hypothetical protein B0J11DRAFT_606613 [Dendryphion nanum]|uniref:DNA mismatch repair protein S5 domain-containing protein n=1 Tax=Dendryphion nanum TaxID=256645 RepID=A0A9P9DRE8_9PLEO|nr:hypothetical protein B0J11DRAFT_606613 [Dendryphion nanum]
MAGSLGSETLKPSASIKVLPDATVRQIGATQLLIDPNSAVKELIDNSIDARATAILVDISSNTIDTIQVKDNGHGITGEDRLLVCRRYCTSKIRSFQDLKGIGGKWLGFRGEAMASMVVASGTMSVMTRVEGEPVAVLLKYDKKGDLASTERASHPVGTTVKLTDLFATFPVRKQATLKDAPKNLSRIKRLMQAYALARPMIRFQLRVTKANSDKGNFNYAPKIGINVEDAAFKIVGRDCASQCGWTAYEADGFELHAFLPKVDAAPAKISNQAAFISIDGRPVKSSRGTPKRINSMFKDRLRKANTAFTSAREPFICINIVCPPESYDPNIQPAKDDVLFEDEGSVLNAVATMFASFYPEAQLTSSSHEPPLTANTTMTTTRPPTMYGIDEEDVAIHPSEIIAPVVEEQEEGARSVEISNPWTIAKMNTSIRSKKSVVNTQLITPAKQKGHIVTNSISPGSEISTWPQVVNQPLTPQSIFRSNELNSPAADLGTNSGMMHPPQARLSRARNTPSVNRDEEVAFLNVRERSWEPAPKLGPTRFSSPTLRVTSAIQRPSISNNGFDVHSLSTPSFSAMPSVVNIPVSEPSHPKPRKRPYTNNPFISPNRGRGSRFNKRGRNKINEPRPPLNLPQTELLAQAPDIMAEDASIDSSNGPGITSKNNTDIRTFFDRDRPKITASNHRTETISLQSAAQRRSNTNVHDDRSLTPAPQISSEELTAQLPAFAERAEPPNSHTSRTSYVGKIGRPIIALDDRVELRAADLSSPAKHRRTQSPPRNSHTARTRSKSAKLPLNFIPTGQATSYYILKLCVSVSAIISSRKMLDMSDSNVNNGENIIEWGYCAAIADNQGGHFGAFRRLVLEEKVTQWSKKVVELLHEKMVCERSSLLWADMIGVVTEGIMKALNEKTVCDISVKRGSRTTS